MQKATDYTNSLHRAGLRITPQRIAICKVLAENKDHPSAGDLYDALKVDYPSISLATIYNTLDVLVGLGLVNALGSIGDDKVHFDADTHPHINLACTKCHKITDLPSNFVDQLDQEISRQSGYQLMGSRLLYYGICPRCQQAD